MTIDISNYLAVTADRVKLWTTKTKSIEKKKQQTSGTS